MATMEVNEPKGDGRAHFSDRIPILSVIGAFVPLRRQGKQHMGVCPLHNDKGPSLSVSEEKNVFFCFGCQQRGGPVQFVMAKEGLDYREALLRACEIAGVDPPDAGALGRGRKVDPKTARLIELNGRAVAFYRMCLARGQGKAAREYLERRGVGQEAVDKFCLGYAPPSGSALYEAIKGLDLNGNPTALNDLVEAGLGNNDERRPDFFVDRVMFPIHDARGDPVGFAGRALDPQSPTKYVNTRGGRDGGPFKKNLLLYNLHRAKPAAGGGVMWLCEGYMDVIALDGAGRANAVALMGTSMDGARVELLRGAAAVKTVVLALDNDRAGKSATVNSARALLGAGFSVSVFMHPDPGVKDVDELLRKRPGLRGPALDELVGGYFPFFARMKRDALPKHGRAEALAPAAQEVAAEIKAYAHEISWSPLAREAAGILGVDPAVMERLVREARAPRPKRARAPQGDFFDINPAAYDYDAPDEEPKAARIAPVDDNRDRVIELQNELRAAENRLIYTFVAHPDAVADFDMMLHDDLEKGWFSQVYKRLQAHHRVGEVVDFARLRELSVDAAKGDAGLQAEYLRRAEAVAAMGVAGRPSPAPAGGYRPGLLGRDAELLQCHAAELRLLRETATGAPQGERLDPAAITRELNEFPAKQREIKEFVSAAVEAVEKKAQKKG